MSHNEHNDPLDQKLKAVLDRQAEQLDGATLSRLRQVRAQALESMQRKRSRFGSNLGWAAGVATTAAMSVTLMLLWPGENNYSQDFVAGLADAELLADEESIEFYEELDFYIWLDQQNSTPGEA